MNKYVFSILPMLMSFTLNAGASVSVECRQEPFAVTVQYNGTTADFQITKDGAKVDEGTFSESQIQHGYESSLLNSYILGMIDQEKSRVFGLAVPSATHLLTTPGEYSGKAEFIFVLPNGEVFESSSLDCMLDVE